MQQLVHLFFLMTANEKKIPVNIYTCNYNLKSMYAAMIKNKRGSDIRYRQFLGIKENQH